DQLTDQPCDDARADEAHAAGVADDGPRAARGADAVAVEADVRDAGIKGKTYIVPDDVKEQILAAVVPGDVDVALRKKLHSAISRALSRPNIPSEIVAKWEADSKKNASKFAFLQAYVQDTSCAVMVIQERHTRTKSVYREKTMIWATKFQVYAMYHAHASEETMQFCNDMLKHAKQRCSDDAKHKRDKRFNIYYVPLANIEGNKDEVARQTSATLTGHVDEMNAGMAADMVRSLGRGIEKDEKPHAENDSGPTRAKAKAKAKSAPKAAKKPANLSPRSLTTVVINKLSADISAINRVLKALDTCQNKFKQSVIDAIKISEPKVTSALATFHELLQGDRPTLSDVVEKFHSIKGDSDSLNEDLLEARRILGENIKKPTSVFDGQLEAKMRAAEAQLDTADGVDAAADLHATDGKEES
ncbi:unnamed protein product, partial [Prorocentrum cordatum]